jgi:hypothetical protein
MLVLNYLILFLSFYTLLFLFIIIHTGALDYCSSFCWSPRIDSFFLDNIFPAKFSSGELELKVTVEWRKLEMIS